MSPAMPAENPICDFCSSPQVHAWYEAEDFNMAEVTTLQVPIVSRAQWAACVDCDALLKAGAWEQLIDRGVDTYIKANPNTPSSARVHFRRAVSQIYYKLRTSIRQSN